MLIGYSYARFSRAEQSQGDSLRRQLERTRNFAAELGVELDETLTDLGVSAFKGANRITGALGAFHQRVQSGQIAKGSYLFIESLDRMSREEAQDALPPFLTLINSGIIIATVQDHQVYSRETIRKSSHLLMFSLMEMMRANSESEMKSQRLRQVWSSKRKRIETGEKLGRSCPAWLSLSEDRRSYEVRPDKVKIVRRIFAESLKGFGNSRIVTGLNRDGIAAFRSGRGWHASSVQAVLNNEAVLGRFQPNRTEGRKQIPDGPVVEGYFPPIITQDQFDLVQAARSERRRKPAGRRGVGYVNLLGGLCRCETCNGPMNLIRKPQRRAYLICDSARRGRCEQRDHFDYDSLEADLLRVIGETDLDRIARQGEGDPIGDELRSIEAKLVRLQSARTRLLDALEQDDDPDIAERIKANRAEITRLQADQKRLLIESKQTSRNGIDLSDIQGRLAGASGDDLYRLRAEIAGELRRVVDVVKFWALPDRNRIVVEVKASRADRVAYVWIDGKFWQGYVVRKSEGFARLSPAKLDELIRTGKGPIALETLPLTPWQPETIHMRDIARSRASRVLNHST